MITIKQVSLAVLAAAMLVTEAAAQRTPAPRQATRRPAAQAAPDQGFWELGTDMNMGVGLDNPTSFFINAPAGTVRAGYYLSNVLTIEPALAFSSIASKSATAVSAWTMQVGGLYHLSADRAKSQFFVHPAIGVTGGSGLNRTLPSMSGAFGLKYPMLSGRLVLRGEAGLNYRFESGPFPSRTNLIAMAGWSVYTR